MKTSSWHGKTVNVANSFGIPFEEDERDSKTRFLDHNYIEGMYDVLQWRVPSSSEHCYIGWTRMQQRSGWSDGTTQDQSYREINDLFKRYIAKLVMAIVDVRPQAVGISTDAYFAVEEIKDICLFLFGNLKCICCHIGMQ